jgi:hypothetical protein
VGVRTDISDDPKGDPSRVLPDQPVPDRRKREGIEPLLPRGKTRRPARVSPDAQTPGDRRGLHDRKAKK